MRRPDFPKSAGIYAIYNIITDTIYIGSSVNLYRRTKQHRTDLKCNRHPNEHLQRSYNKYGVDAFEMRLLELTEDDSKENLHRLEQIWFDHAKSNFAAVFNERVVVESTRGLTHTAETREKIRQNSREFMNRPDVKAEYSRRTRERMSNPIVKAAYKRRSEKIWNITLYDPNNISYFVERNLKEFCAEHGLLFSNMLRVVKGLQAHHKGWRTNLDFDYVINHASANTYDVCVISPNGAVFGPIKNAKQFADAHNLEYTAFLKVLLGQRKTHKGWKLHYEREIEKI